MFGVRGFGEWAQRLAFVDVWEGAGLLDYQILVELLGVVRQKSGRDLS